MNIHSGRCVVVGATVLAVLLGAGSVAWACVPNFDDSGTKFYVTPATGTYGSGAALTANGRGLEKADWKYYVRLRSGEFSSTNQSDCGTFGTLQTVATTDSSGNFTTSFTLDTVGQAPPLGPGPAYFCALPSPNKYTSLVIATWPVSQVTSYGTVMYIDTWAGQITLV